MNKALIGIFFILVILATGCGESPEEPQAAKECLSDSDCVPASCCHPSSCVAKEQAPDCSGMMCTMECSPGTLDCGQGRCLCAGGKCRADLNNPQNPEEAVY